MAVNFTGSLAISGSLTATSTITAQTLVVQTITSSVVQMTGSNIFGSILANTQTFTGSVNITGSLNGVNATFSGSGAYLDIKSTTTTGTINVYGVDTSANFIGYLVSSDSTSRWRAGMVDGRKFEIKAADGSGNFTTTPAITILSGSNNVGIGTNSPSHNLHIEVSASSPTIRLYDGANNNYIGGAYATGNLATGTAVGNLVLRSSTGIAFSSNNGTSVALAISSSGFVGIGITNPSHLLTIVGGTTTPGSYSGGNYYLGMYSGSASTVLRETFAMGADANFVYVQSFSSKPLYINQAGNNIILGNSTNGVNVGVGTISPGSRFHVYSGMTTLTAASSGQYDLIRLEDNAGSARGGIGVNTSGFMYLSNTTGGTQHFVLNSSGNVGIGLTSPFSKLSLPSGTGWNGGLAWDYTTNNSASKRWWVNTDQIVYGDFRICTEITQGSGSISNVATLYDRFYINPSGYVGINTTSPYTRFHIDHAVGTTKDYSVTGTPNLLLRDTTAMAANVGGALLFAGYKTTGGGTGYFAAIDGIKENGTDGSESGVFRVHTANTSGIFTERMRISSAGVTQLSGPTLSAGSQSTYGLAVGEAGYLNLTLGYKQATAGYIQTWSSTALYLNQQGNAVYAGAVRLDTLSDQRIKDNIQPLTNSLDKVLQLNGKKFHLKDEPEDKIRYGFIAQELEGILDEFVINTDMKFEKGDLVVENVKSIENWASSWAALLVEAIKELKSENDSLKTRIEQLEQK